MPLRHNTGESARPIAKSIYLLSFLCNPLFRDHVSCETTFLWQKGWSLMTGFTVVTMHVIIAAQAISS